MKKKQPRVLTRAQVEHKIQLAKIDIVNYSELVKNHPTTSLSKPRYMARLNGNLNGYIKLLSTLSE